MTPPPAPGHPLAGGKKKHDLPLLPRAERHLVQRFSYGITPELAKAVDKAGGASAWFEQQLKPASVDDREARKVDAWWPELTYSAGKLWQRQIGGQQAGWQVMDNYQRRALQRRMRTHRPVLELMTDFWENHLNVPANGDAQFTYRASYGDHIRAHALGKYSDLLAGAITHPAMLIYLDQVSSTRAHPNENLGRELLECHTVGQGSYTEDHVKASARILTGWTVDMYETWQPLYDPEEHWRGPVRVMGFRDPNKKKDGQDLTRRYLDYLAHHPATARRIAWKLAVKFVRDQPSLGLVNHLAKVYRKHDTQIAPVLQALVESAEFKRSEGLKVRDPSEDVVATYRLLGVTMGKPQADDAAVNAMIWQSGDLGIRPVSWPRPDGQPFDNTSWSSPARLMASMDMHYTLSGGWWPTQQVQFIEPKDRLPAPKVRFADLVDHLCREILHRPAGDRLLRACCQAVGARPKEWIDKDHGVVGWNMPRLLTTILDSPDFMSR